jgi:hypothetical protein
MQDPRKLEVRPAVAQENTSASRVDFSKPFIGGQGRFIGRVIVEQFEAADARDDGIHYRISFPASAAQLQTPARRSGPGSGTKAGRSAAQGSGSRSGRKTRAR